MKPASLTLNPTTWDPTERDDYLDRSSFVGIGPAFDRGGRAMVIGSSGPFAELAGRRALEVGGTAADAVLTTALAKVVLAYGCWVSFAGIFSMVYYEAAADKVHSLHAGYKTFRDEASPLTLENCGGG
jgi:gamma-glutamyltranspeptidase / glutathione hydrolase